MEKNVKRCEFSVEGMHCDSCELYVEETLKKQKGVSLVDATSKTQRVKFFVDESTDIDELREKVNAQLEKNGYRIVDELSQQQKSRNQLIVGFIFATVITLFFVWSQRLNTLGALDTSKLSLPTIFLLGVLASLSTCMAVVGGLVMSLSSTFAQGKKVGAISTFHGARLIGFVIFGGLVGLLGKAVIVSNIVAVVLKAIVAVAMLAVGADLLGHKFRFFTLPKSLSKRLKLFEDPDGWYSAVLFGAGSFFLPCGFTQSMQLYAMSTGSFWNGAMVMGVFALGTLPVLGLVSFTSASGVSKLNKSVFGYTMGFLIILLALLNLLGASISLGLLPNILGF